MSIKFSNKEIREVTAPSTITCVMAGSITAGCPVGIYLQASGVVTAIGAAVASNSTNWGISSEAAATGAVTQIIVAGQATLKVATHTAGQLIAAIDIAGSATTAAAASSTAVVALGVMKSSSVAYLY
jgi:hypothetical protein